MTVRVAAAQFAASASVEANVDKVVSLARKAEQAGAQIVCFQELCTSLYFPLYPTSDTCFDLAESVLGPTTERVGETARELGLYVVLPLYEECSMGRFFNSAVLIDPSGAVVGHWRKNHIPRVHLAGLEWGEIDEKYFFEPGDGSFPVVETGIGRIGVMICHDRHFPESGRLLALGGAEVVFVPTASRGLPDVDRPEEMWLVELQAHALQNMYYVCGVNRVGVENGQRFLGHSVMIAVDGQVMTQTGQDEAILIAEIDVHEARKARIARGFLRDRRPEIYSPLARSYPWDS